MRILEQGDQVQDQPDSDRGDNDAKMETDTARPDNTGNGESAATGPEPTAGEVSRKEKVYLPVTQLFPNVRTWSVVPVLAVPLTPCRHFIILLLTKERKLSRRGFWGGGVNPLVKGR
jgi:hypothetical protein